MTSKKLLLAGLVAALGLAGTSQAAVIHISPRIGAILNPDFSPVDASSIVSQDASGVVLNPNGAKYIAQIDFVLTITDLQAGQLGYGNAAVNINLAGVAQSADLPGWLADNFTTVDANGPAIGGNVPKWAGNQDSGSDATDLQNILVETAPKGFNAFEGDPRRSIGIAPYNNTGAKTDLGPVTDYEHGDYFGSVLIDISGVPGMGSLSAFASEGSVYNDALDLTAAGVTGAPAQGLSFQVVPEPSTFALLGLGGALLAFARKRR